MNEHDLTYIQLLDILTSDLAEDRTDRTGVGTRGIFGAQMRFSLAETFPLLTTKSVHWKSVVHELLWIMRGDTNIKYLQENGVRIWNEWADENGELGPVYGKQWRNWEYHDGQKIAHVDQLKMLLEALRNRPNSRRHIVSAWNPAQVDSMALPPCHSLFQFWVSQRDNSLHCQLYQRSADIFLGVPFNIASYSLLTCILADTLGFKRGSFVWTGGDVHLYQNHIEQARLQIDRARNQAVPPSPTVLIKPMVDPLAVTFNDIELVGYEPLGKIAAKVAV